MRVASTLYTFDTIYSADSCEVCPCPSPGYQHVLATGTYQVNKLNPESESPDTERLGRIYIHHVTPTGLDGKIDKDPRADEEEKEEQEEEICQLAHSLEVPAVLDMKWAGGGGGGAPRLGVANAEGRLLLYSVSGEGESGEEPSFVSDVKITDGLALSLEWSWNSDRIAVSDSKGKVSLVQPTPSHLEEVHSFEGHSYEAWTTCFSRWDDNLIFSGGDDCSFNSYDLRSPGNTASRKNSKVHGMGVTSMLSSSLLPHMLYTGSYDENLRCWDERQLKLPVWERRAGGGLWRIKERAGRLLLAAMHGGFAVVEAGSGDSEEIVRYTEHESLAYGADWIADNMAATASFYDHSLRIWRF